MRVLDIGTGTGVLDIGTGTGILAILAMKLGAAKADGCDVENWAVENCRENALRNEVEVYVTLGNASTYAEKYDIVLSNINRNVILEELSEYARLVAEGSGIWACSGFYEGDQETIITKAGQFGLVLVSSTTKDGWSCMTFSKES
jgi:ribosomal protein L11 methyltransferase